jgi:DNA-binding NarL/FixJ family response regulator
LVTGKRGRVCSRVVAPVPKDVKPEVPAAGRSETQQVLLIDDHVLFAEGLSLLLSGMGDHVVVSHARTCEEALGLLAGWTPSLILFDLALPGASHLQAFELLRESAPGVPIVAVSADERRRMVTDLVRAGARGYVPKSTNSEVMLSALRLVMAGGTYVPELVVLEAGEERADSPLTARELEVLELLAAGQTNKQMATDLGMAESTVRVHVTSILRRLKVASRFEAATSPLALALLGKRRPSSSGTGS